MSPKLFKFSVQNAFRRKSILVIALIGTGLGTALMATLVSMSNGMDAELSRTMNMVASDIHVIAADSGTMTSMFGGGTPLPASYLDQIAIVDNIKDAEPVVTSIIPREVLDAGLPMSPMGVFLTGVDLKLNELAEGATTKIIEGRSIENEHEILMGSLAMTRPGADADNALEVGDTIDLPIMKDIEVSGAEEVVAANPSLNPLMPQRGEELIVEKPPVIEKITFTVVGIYETGSSFDDGGFIGEISEVREVTGMSQDEVSSFTVTAENTSVVEEVATDIDAVFENSSIPVQTTLSKDVLGELNDTLDIFQTFILVISLVAAIAGGMSIFIIMLMSVIDRLQEFGIFKATGWSNFSVIISVIIESITVALMGSLVGLCIGFIVGSMINKQMDTQVALFDVQLILFILAFGIIMGVLGGVLPALKAAKVSPIETLHSL